MSYIRKADQRGMVDIGWLKSKHSFSFGHYYDHDHMGVSVLRVINDDTVAPGAGFDTHGHRDMEIISYVLEGELEHQDNQGNRHIVRPGEVQRMSAGTGVMHSEFNPSKTNRVKFLQIWIIPNKVGVAPSYQQKKIEQHAKLTPLVTPDGHSGSISMHQDASLYRLKLSTNDSLHLQYGTDRQGYLHVIEGDISVNGVALSAGDAIAPDSTESLEFISNDSEVEALWFDLPKKKH
ncbi:pirin family protein [Glaciecola sp. 1036]|uniref:pirin family protein n=1 Tax=Alteromonadaceae TaxID=72275 RepID=UPI003D073CD4